MEKLNQCQKWLLALSVFIAGYLLMCCGNHVARIERYRQQNAQIQTILRELKLGDTIVRDTPAFTFRLWADPHYNVDGDYIDR